MPNSVTASAPTTIANFGPGFDCLGVAFDWIRDEVTITKRDDDLISLQVEAPFDIPQTLEDNLVGAVVRAMLERLPSENRGGVSIHLNKKLPLGSGLGSSAASSVAAVVALNTLFDNFFSKKECLEFAAYGEKCACGTAHYDNVAPALYGGICFLSSDPLYVTELPLPKSLWITVLHPNCIIKTEQSRSVLPKAYSASTVSKQLQTLGALVSTLALQKEPLQPHLFRDLLAEPFRANMIPEFRKIEEIAFSFGALGFGISGSGPAMFAVTANQDAGQEIAEKGLTHFTTQGIQAQAFCAPPSPLGVKITL